jgi:hypothetical protein
MNAAAQYELLDELDDDGLEALDESDGLDDLDEAFADDFGGDDFGADAFGADELEELDALDDALDDLGAEDAWEDADDFDVGDEFGDFALDAASGLYVPGARPQPLIHGAQALAIARRLNPRVLEAMDADDADAFFRRIGRAIGGAVRRVGRVAGGIARGVGQVARVAAPLLQRALPMIQRVAGLAGPWGRLVSAGLGAAQGLMQGRGLRGALAGAVGGLIPGVGGRLASAILRFDGADDDGALDALADMADAGEVDEAVALPLGAGLAARMAARAGFARPAPGGGQLVALPRHRQLWQGAREAERIMLWAARMARGSTGRRLRLLRQIARMSARLLRRQPPATAARNVPRAVRSAARRVVRRARQNPQLGRRTPAQAQRRTQARRRILRRVPVQAVFRGHILMR